MQSKETFPIGDVFNIYLNLQTLTIYMLTSKSFDKVIQQRLSLKYTREIKDMTIELGATNGCIMD